MMRPPYIKLRFVSKTNEETAGLILPASLVHNGKINVTEASRYFPISEFRKMERIEISPAFDDWHDAFNYSFTEEEK